MKIVATREITVPIASAIRNAYIDFSQMTASVVAIVTDVKRDGKPVIGFGFNSNGRYAPSGLLRERFIPRLEKAAPETLLDAAGLVDPAKAWDAMMCNEKPGGHGERSVAVGVLDMALWDAVAKAEGVPLWRLLAERFRGAPVDERAWVYAAGGYYYPGKDLEQLRAEMRSYRERGYRCVKMKIGGASLDEDRRRIEAVLQIVGSGDNLAVDVNGRFNAPGGVVDYVERYGTALQALLAGGERKSWSGELVANIAAERRDAVPASGLAARQIWRDRRLMALLRHKQQAAREIGD